MTPDTEKKEEEVVNTMERGVKVKEKARWEEEDIRKSKETRGKGRTM